MFQFKIKFNVSLKNNLTQDLEIQNIDIENMPEKELRQVEAGNLFKHIIFTKNEILSHINI